MLVVGASPRFPGGYGGTSCSRVKGEATVRPSPDRRAFYEEERPSMSRGTNGKGRSKMSVGEAASRVGKQVYHTGQGRTEASRSRPYTPWPRSGLDSAWSLASNPHRESG